jgi:hypothetical protein
MRPRAVAPWHFLIDSDAQNRVATPLSRALKIAFNAKHEIARLPIVTNLATADETIQII